jgi:Zn-dependent protease/predicted transcriptional regulator
MAEAVKENAGGNSIKLFKVAGIQVTIDYSWFIVLFLVLWSLSAGYFPRNFPGLDAQAYWSAGAVATFFFFASVLIHELSHSLMAIRSGIKIPEITFFIFGGISRLSEEAQDPVTELKIALVGPLSSFALALFFWIIERIFFMGERALIGVVFGYLAWVNLALGVFNLNPGFTLDSGRVLRALIWLKTNSLTKATKWASDIGKGFALTLMFFGGLQIFSGALIGGLWFIFIGMFLRGVAESGYQQVVVKHSLENVHVDEVMTQDITSVTQHLPLTDLIHDYFLTYGYKGFPVIDDGEVVGVVSLTNVRNIPKDELSIRKVRDVMAPLSPRITIAPRESLSDALTKMAREELGRLLVMENGRFFGMITRTGVLRILEIKRALES